MCIQKGLPRLLLDLARYNDFAGQLNDKISDLTYKHTRMKIIKADTYELAQEIREIGIQKARAEGKAQKIEKVILGNS